MKKVAILYIATGRYIVFWEEFYRSAQAYLLADTIDYQKHFFIFTDCTQKIAGEDGNDVSKIFQAKLTWPHSTLMRFDVFLSIKEQLKRFDYIYFFNGNTVFEAPVTAEELIPGDSEALVLGLQPHMFLLPRKQFTYETDSRSTAAIKADEGEYYFMGGVNGGGCSAYLEMCAVLSRNTHQDLANGVIALWHDESHLNRYAIGRSDIKILPPLFTRGETENWKRGSKLYFADKSHYRFGGHDYLRGKSDIPISQSEWEKEQLRFIQKPDIGKRCGYQVLRVLHYASQSKPWKILYRGFIPKHKRLKLEKGKFEEIQQQWVGDFWKRKLQDYRTGRIEKFFMRADGVPELPKNIIWQYWSQGWREESLPDIVKLCRKSVDKYCGDYTVIRLDDTNVSKYLNIPDFVKEKLHSNSDFKIAFYSDLIRVMLLHAYGGVWLDATVLLTDTLPEKYTVPDLFMFQRSNVAEHKKFWMEFNRTYFNWSKNRKINILNSIIFAKKSNATLQVMQDLLLDFWKTQNSVPHYFFFQILFDELKKSEYAAEPYPEVDDTLPHLMQIAWNEPVTEERTEQIIYQNSIHKLTYISLGAPDTLGYQISRLITK